MEDTRLDNILNQIDENNILLRELIQVLEEIKEALNSGIAP